MIEIVDRIVLTMRRMFSFELRMPSCVCTG